MTNVVHNLTINGKSIDGALGIQTQDFRMKAQTNPLSYGGPITLFT